MSSWTLQELHRMPDDGNRYELVRGELFVTPPPSVEHQSLAAVLGALLQTYVQAQRLGRIYHPRTIIRIAGSEVEPDLMVRPAPAVLSDKWEDQPLPVLVVEVLSRTTRRRDLGAKRKFYMDEGIPEYWIVDRWTRTIRVVKPGHDEVYTDTLIWSPEGASAPLAIDVRDYFRNALGS